MTVTLTPYQRRIMQLGLVVFIAIPIGLWFASQSLSVWSTWPGVFRSLGHVCGLLGATLFSINFILAARLPWVEEVLNGLPKLYNVHHLFGGLAFMLLLVHPVFLGLQYVTYSLPTAANFFIPNINDVPKLLGVAAMGVLTTLLLITFFIRIAYQNWKITHQWLGLALFLASLHVYLIPGHLDTSPWLRGFMVALMMAGLVAFVYRVLFGRWLVHRFNYVVDKIKVHNGLATEVVLRPMDKKISYKPGQFFFMQVQDQKRISNEAHPFSFTSSPNSDVVSMAAKVSGDYTSLLQDLAKGMQVQIEGPYGRFWLRANKGVQVWVAGGIGITPFMSRVRELSREDESQTHLYYVVKNLQQALFAQELLRAAANMPGFEVSIWESEQRGRFMATHISEMAISDASYFLCGPTPMMVDLKQQLHDNKVAKYRITTEEFKLY